MKVALFGNNDGPGRLANALKGSGHEVVFLGLQKQGYPDERSLIEGLEGLTYQVFINCFGNFHFKALHLRAAALNVHLAPLPAYRGRHPLQWALINGEKTFGITIHDMTDGYDAGPIRWQGEVDIEDGWSARELRAALMQRLEGGFLQFLNAYDPKAAGTPNDDVKATYVTRRYPKDSRMTNWYDRDRVYRKVNALRHDDHPAFVRHNDAAYALTAARRGPRFFDGAVAGTIVGRTEGEIEIVCGDGRTVWINTEAPLKINDRL